MGNHIAKLEGQDLWIVFQSTVGANYEPMFRDELSAWLFAHVVTGCPGLEAGEYSLGRDVQHFVRLSYGGGVLFNETDVYLNELADVTGGLGSRPQLVIDDLASAFRKWQQNPRARVELREERPVSFDEFDAID